MGFQCELHHAHSQLSFWVHSQEQGWDRSVSLGVSVSVPSHSIQFWAFGEGSI